MMKILSILLNIYNFLYIYDIQNIKISEELKFIDISDSWIEKNISSFQLGFYIKILNMKKEINIVTITDLIDFNIEFIIKNNWSIYINNINTNFFVNDYSFFFIEGKIINNKINLDLFLNNLSNKFMLIYEKPFYNNNFAGLKIILGNNKNLFNFQFIGNISCLCSYINNLNNEFDNISKCNSKILVYHNYRINIKNSNYFNNELENGFSGSLNGNSKYIDINDINIIEILNTNNKIITETYFEMINSYISLSIDFIQYLSKFKKISYSVYLSLKFDYSFKISNSMNIEFYFYKRNTWNFYCKITNVLNDNNYDYEIYSSNSLENSSNANKITYFKIILLKIFNTTDNNFLINYQYKTNNNISNNFDLNIQKNEIHNFSNDDKHFIGIFNFSNNNWMKLKIYIYESALIWGSGIHEIDNKLYTKYKDEYFVLFCNNNSINIKNRWAKKYNICENDDETGNKNLIDFCLLYKNNICYKCVTSKKLVNNSCVNQNNNTYYDENNLLNYKKYLTFIDNVKKSNHIININNLESKKKFFLHFQIEISNEKNFIIGIKLNNIYNKFILINSNIFLGNLDFNLELYLKNNDKIEIEKLDSNLINYKLDIYSYDIINYRKNIRPFENCKFFNNNENYVHKIVEFMLFECIDKNYIPNNYYLNKNWNIILKCDFKCSKCINTFTCTECKPGYNLINNYCIKINNIYCEDSFYYNCKKCKIDSKFYLLNKYFYNCFSECYVGCKNCNSILFNECLSCEIGYFYYPELKECIYSNKCKNDYIKLNSSNTCIKNCKKKSNLNNCISCYDSLYLNNFYNRCDECLDGFFKNYKILDIDNKPICEKCDQGCKTCIDIKNSCTSCNDNKFLEIDSLKCINKCQTNYYEKEKLCINCELNCLKCDKNNCLKCSNNKLLKLNKCVNKCGNNYYKKDNKCIKCINNCKSCTNHNECLKCKSNFYLNKNKICVKCNLKNQIISKNNCFECTNNCEICKNSFNNCLKCKYGFKLKKFNNFSLCLKKCKNNYYYDLNSNKCTNCNKCLICYSNFKLNCFNCTKCNIKCKLNLIYNNEGIKILNDSNLIGNIIFNLDYKINNINSKNILIKNGIFFKFNNYNHNKIKINLKKNDIIWKSKNCYDFEKKNYLIKKSKLDCKIKSIKTLKKNKKLYLEIISDFYWKKNFIINFNIKETKRKVEYYVKNHKKEKNKSKLLIRIYPNHFRNNFKIILKLNKKFIKVASFCNTKNIYHLIKIKNYYIKKFKSDYLIKKENISKLKNFNIYNEKEFFSKFIKNVLSNLFLIIVIINIFNYENFILFLRIIQLIYILEFILLWPINLGDFINSFIYYFKLDLDFIINFYYIFKINNQEITKYYKDLLLNNPKISEIKYLNILNINLLIIILFFICIFNLIITFIKNNFLIVNIYNNKTDFNNLKFFDKLIVKTKIIEYKIIETIFPIIFTILIVYLTNINKFKLNFDNIKILFFLIIYYLIIWKYLKNWLNSIIYLKYKKYDNILNKIFYEKIIIFNIKKNFNNYLIYQIIFNLRQISFITIIFWLKNFNIHSFLFLFIQFIFLIHLLKIKNKYSLFLIQKLKLEETINLIWIISIILNYYLNLKQFQLSFVISYIILFSINYLLLILSSLTNWFMFLRKFFNYKSKKKLLIVSKK